MASILSVVFLILGLACQFLLTMQKFTAAIQGIVFLAISLGLCIYLERQRQPDESDLTWNRVLAVVAAVVILVNVVQLPQSYEDQKAFQRIIEDARGIENRGKQTVEP